MAQRTSLDRLRTPAVRSDTLRFDRLDALRGFAMLWMTFYHFCFDLNHFKWINQDFYTNPLWTWQRTLIVSLFLLCAGAGQAIAMHQGQTWPRFWRRWTQVAACALLVSAGSYAMYPQSFIYFGVLHGIAIMLIIVRLTAHWGSWLWLAGGIIIAIKFIAAYAISTVTLMLFLNGKAFNWLGLISVKPITEDYVPLVPWLALMWWGMATASYVLKHRPALLTKPLSGALQWCALLGSYSLLYYMLHQPVLIGILQAVRSLR